MRKAGIAIGLLACAAVALAGCALLSKSDPLVPRYYSPDRRERPPGAVQPGMALSSPAAIAAQGEQPQRLRLGRIRSGSHLRERILFRNADDELGYDEERRWTERPDVYLRRALSRALFEERGLVRVVSGQALTLELELVAFEEVRTPARKARLQVVILLHDEHVVRLEQTLVIEQPVRDAGGRDSTAAVVAALGEALHAGVEQIADRVLANLEAMPATPPITADGVLEPRPPPPIEARATDP